jgi:Uma2 family endonuclease
MPHMPSPTVTTAEQLFVFHEPGYRHELVRGEVRGMSPSGPVHGFVAGRITRLLASCVDEADLGWVFTADAGFVLARNPDTVRAPDVGFVRKDRLLTRYPPGFFPGPPDLAVEVTSPSDSFTEVHEKALCWIEHGTRLVWVVDPIARRVSEYRSRQAARLLELGDELDGGEVVPGFRIRVRDLFPDGT